MVKTKRSRQSSIAPLVWRYHSESEDTCRRINDDECTSDLLGLLRYERLSEENNKVADSSMTGEVMLMMLNLRSFARA
jgi:hypothetical protein